VVNPRTVPDRLVRGAAQGAALAGLVVGSRVLLGVWAAAVVLAALGLGRLLVLWARVEARTFDGDRPAVVVQGAGLSRAEHLVFARALAVVAEAYLAECEREAR